MSLPRTRQMIRLITVLGLCGFCTGVALVAGHPAVFERQGYHVDKAYWSARIAKIGGAKAYAEFAQQIQKDSAPIQHELAHEFGSVLYQALGTAGFSFCDSQFSSGCYHELLGLAIRDYGKEGASLLNGKCIEELGFKGATPCQHGIGHGLVAYFGYKPEYLKESLDVCNSLSASDGTKGCLGGAFMEYNFYTMSGADLVRPVDGDLYAPCDTLDPKYTDSCYFWLPQWWEGMLFDLHSTRQYTYDVQVSCESSASASSLCVRWRENLSAIFKLEGTRCGSLPAEKARACFNGLGYIIFPRSNFDQALAAAYCKSSTSVAAYQKACISFAAQS